MTSIIHKRTPTDEDKDVRVKKVGKVLHHNHSFDNRIFSFPQNREHKKHCHFSNDSTTLFPLLDLIIESGHHFEFLTFLYFDL